VRLRIQLKKYRTFPIDQPAEFTIGHGFTGIVGPNNAGKSTLLRFFYESRHYWERLSSANGNLLVALTQEAGDSSARFNGVYDQVEVFSNLNALGIEIRLTLEHDYEQPADTPLGNRYLTIPTQLIVNIDRSGNWKLRIADPGDVVQSEDLAWSGTILAQGGTPIFEFEPWFEVFRALASALYIGAFRNALNAGASSYYDVSVGTAFIQDWNNFRSGPGKAQNVAALQLTNEIKRIFGLDELDIVASADDSTLQLVIDGQPYRLDEVGGGLTHFVLVLAYVATRRPAIILFDEPELNLHPSLQLDFLTTVGSYASIGVLFASHSLGLARAAGGEVYTVRRIQPRSKRGAATKRDPAVGRISWGAEPFRIPRAGFQQGSSCRGSDRCDRFPATAALVRHRASSCPAAAWRGSLDQRWR
jgi:ABC-type branched-subunit amino acid transport system ATPase component